MFKNILIYGLLCTVLSAESFDTFLQKAIKNSPYLESSALAVKQAKSSGAILTRYENPTLELEYSNFSPNIGSNDNGYRVNYSQPIRLWSIGDDNEALSNNIYKNANALFTQQKAIFTRDISLQFTSYAKEKMFLALGDEELKIAKLIYEISKARYESGTLSRGLLLQAKIDYEMVQIKNESASLISLESYYNLLKIAGINEEINLDASHTFIIKNKNDNLNNPDLKVLQSEQDKSVSQAKVDSNKVSWMNVFAEFEAEPEQDITRVGISFPLAFFNTKSEEKQIATLQANRAQLLLNNQTKRLSIEQIRLTKQRISLQKQQAKNEEILTSETELLEMFKNAYKIANINLLQLQDIKNKVISTKRNLILIKSALDQNTIITNYNQGLYND